MENNFTDFREAVSLEKIFEIVQENTLKCLKLISFLGSKKLSLNQCQAWSCYYATGCFVAFLGDFYIEIRVKYEKNILLSSSRAFSLSTPTFLLSTPVENSEATWKKATKCNKHFLVITHVESFVASPLIVKSFS